SFTLTVKNPAAVSTVTPPANGTYGIGQNLDFTVTYSENVTVTGTPTIGLTIGTTARSASYNAAGSTATALLFRYTVQAGESDTNGIVSASPIVLSGGSTNKDALGFNAALTFTPPTTTGVLVDGVAPTVSSITRANASPTNAASVSFTVTFSKSVTGVDS